MGGVVYVWVVVSDGIVVGIVSYVVFVNAEFSGGVKEFEFEVGAEGCKFFSVEE